MKFKIEKNIPIPEESKNMGGRPCKYPFANLELHDSFWAAVPTNNLHNSAKRWCASNNKNWKFQVRTNFLKGVKGSRIWRIK